MIKVTILAFQNAMASTIVGPMDMLNQAGQLWNMVNGAGPEPCFNVAVATSGRQPIQCDNRLTIVPHTAVDQVKETDLILIAAVANVEKTVKHCPEVIPWIHRQFQRGAHVGSICTGAFLLGKTGLLDGKSATLHWGFTKIFKQMFPKITVQPERLLIDHGRLYCSAGTNAGLDLSLYLVEKFCGRQIAIQCAKAMVFDMGRRLQTPYADFLFAKDHCDKAVLVVQKWIEDHYTHSMDYNRLARDHGMSRRSLERRFKKATGVTPLVYLQQLRIASAKRMIETGSSSMDEIAHAIGYEDLSFFRKLFERISGLQPKAYRELFTN